MCYSWFGTEGGGFCVVAADSGFPESLLENLSQLSNYSHHPSSDPDDIIQNPIIYSHTIIDPNSTTIKTNTTASSLSSLPSSSSSSSSSFNLPSSQQSETTPKTPPIPKTTNKNTWHVLSRIAPSGKDNHHQLAHHVVLSEDELVIEGPAWLLALAG
ncbi:MAG: hypothetical protein LBL39_07490, partial [Planctomycetaceae bacterium]|nr:hypothetical protein [Planctomycetaceae bacterium]